MTQIQRLKREVLREHLPGLVGKVAKLWAATLLDAGVNFARSLVPSPAAPFAAESVLLSFRLAWATTRLAPVVVAEALR